MNQPMLAAHTAERIRESLRDTSEHVRSVVLGTAVWSLYAFASFTGLGKSSRARRNRELADRHERHSAAGSTERVPGRALN